MTERSVIMSAPKIHSTVHSLAVTRLARSSTAGSSDRRSAPHGQRDQDQFEERLRDNTVTPVPDQAAFRHDFPRWLERLSDRDRRLAEAMAADETTTAVAARFGVSPGRVSQLRRNFKDDWEAFTA